jgi:uncharacterized membrane protein (UPF0127 family)
MEKLLKVINERDKSVIASRIRVADSFWKRFRGLMLSSEPSENEGLLISPCSSIHMMFMLYPIDAIFIDAGNQVKALYERLAPWTGISGWHKDAGSVIELKSGTINKTGVRINDILRMEQL